MPLSTRLRAGKHVVFGKVENGQKTVKHIENAGSYHGPTKEPVVIANCGEIKDTKKDQ